MILNETIEVKDQIQLLIENGWYEDAQNCAAVTHEHGLISKDAHDAFLRATAGKPASTQRGHEVYGLANGFNGHTVLSSLQFERLHSPEEMKRAFKQAVTKIEIETSTQCNRHCTYCPNSQPAFSHRLKKNDFLDMNVLRKMLTELQEIDYSHTISLVGMNEFFMHEENFAYAELVKKMLPKVRLQIYTNGDYLDRDYMERAERAGVDMLVVSFHLQAGKAYNTDDILDRAAKFMKRTQMLLSMTDFQKGSRLHFQGQLGRLHVLAGLVNWDTDGHNWSGTVSSGKDMADMTMPCQSPVNILCLTQGGDFTLCCAVPRERTPENIANGALLGNLADYPSIFHAYASDAMLYWRQHSFSTTNIPPLCQTCSARNHVGNKLNKSLAEFIEQQHEFIDPPHANVQAPLKAVGCGSR